MKNGDVTINNLNEFLNESLESAGKIDEINRIDKKISHNENELTLLKNNISSTEEKFKSIREMNDDSATKKIIEDMKNKLMDLEDKVSKKNENIAGLRSERDEIIKKCLMKLHSEMKIKYKKVNEDHDRYVDLYTKAREERHIIERKMMNIKSLVYKNYKIRLV